VCTSRGYQKPKLSFLPKPSKSKDTVKILFFERYVAGNLNELE